MLTPFWQMASCMPASTLILWEQTRPSFAHWANTQPWGPTSITPAGSTVCTKCLNHGVPPRKSSLLSGESARYEYSTLTLHPTSCTLTSYLINLGGKKLFPSSNYCLVKLNPWPLLKCLTGSLLWEFHFFFFFKKIIYLLIDALYSLFFICKTTDCSIYWWVNALYDSTILKTI